MSAEYVGTSDVRHFLIGETESVFPLAFSASVLQADDNADELGNIYEQVGLASKWGVRLITVALTLGSFLHNSGRISAADTRLLSRIVHSWHLQHLSSCA